MKTLIARGDLPERLPDWVPLNAVALHGDAGHPGEVNVARLSAGWVELDIETRGRRVTRYLNT